MLEGLKKQENRSAMNTLRAGVAALTLLSAVGHEKAQAAEILPTATWEQGVNELHRGVMQDPVEYAAVAAVLPGKKIAWPSTIRGEADGVKAYFSKTIRELADQTNGEAVLNYCDIHTHPVASAATEFGITGRADNAYFPPSVGDAWVVTRGGRQDVIPKYAKEKGVDIKQLTTAAFDPHGVWYYRTLNEEERAGYQTLARGEIFLDENQNDFIKRIHEPFTRASVKPGFDFWVEYGKLRSAYRQRLGTEIRFVSYDELKSEPPCAGTDYNPK